MKNSANLSSTTVDEVLEWAEEMARKGLYDSNTGRHLRTALKAMVSVLDANEAQDPLALRENLDSTAARWARANKANPGTMKTYKQRAGALLSDFIGFMESPASFKGRGGPAGSKAAASKNDGGPDVPRAKRPAASVADAPAKPTLASAYNTFRLPTGRVFQYSLPEGFTTEDLRRVVYHLLPATADFDPMSPGGMFPAAVATLGEAGS